MMNTDQTNQLPPKGKILVSPLPWGLGHATRSSHVVQVLLEKGYQVLLGVDPSQKNVLQKLLPEVEQVSLTGFKMVYPKSFYAISMLFHLVRFHYWKWAEHFAVKKIVRKYGPFCSIISDNRYGVWHTSVPSILITHQLSPAIPESIPLALWVDQKVQKMITSWCRPFKKVWVPDVLDSHHIYQSLAGELAQSQQIHADRIRYIGWLVAFSMPPNTSSIENTAENNEHCDWCVLISGPEPYRSMFVEEAVQKFANWPGRVVVVGGQLPSENTVQNEKKGSVEVIPYLPSSEIKILLQNSNRVMCRSGYTTLMEAAYLRLSRIVFVPTPGQSEQEYLARYLEELGVAPLAYQGEWDASILADRMNNYSGFTNEKWGAPLFPIMDTNWEKDLE